MGCCSSSKKDYYSILGISEKATKEEIEKGYFQVTSNIDIETENEEQKNYFYNCTEAYYIIRKNKKKIEYDKYINGKIDNFNSDFDKMNPIEIYNNFLIEMKKKEKIERMEKEFNEKKERKKQERLNLGLQKKKSILPNLVVKDILFVEFPEGKNYIIKNVSTIIKGKNLNLKILHIKNKDNNIIHHVFEHSKDKIYYFILDEDNGKNNEKNIKDIKEEKEMIKSLINEIQ